MEVTKANLATYLVGLTPRATPYPIEITETVAGDWGNSSTAGTIGSIIIASTPSGVYLDLGLTIIPNSVINMYRTFYNCTPLTKSPAIPNSVTNMGYTFTLCTSLTTAPVIPLGVKRIDLAFHNCTSLTTVPIIPNSVNNMFQTFYYCPVLHTIQNFAVDVDNCAMTDAFSNCPALANIYVTTLTESSWHLLYTNTGATGTDYTIYNPDGTVAGSGTVAGTSQVLTLYGKSDELVISANITPTLAVETATSQVQWHKSGLPYDDELMIFNAKNPTTVISNLLITTLRYSASFTLPTYLDGQKIRIANTHATNTITCTLPSGQTMNGQSSFTIAPDTLLEFELIGTAWKCVSNEWELVWTNPSPTNVLSGITIPITNFVSFSHYKILYCFSYNDSRMYSVEFPIEITKAVLNIQDDYMASRSFTHNSTSIIIANDKFVNSYGSSITTGAYAIPYKIYGKK